MTAPLEDEALWGMAAPSQMSALMSGSVGRLDGFRWREGVAVPITWKWWSWRAWAHHYRWPGGSDAWYPYVDEDALEDPAYDRLYDTPDVKSFDMAAVINRWAAQIWIDAARKNAFWQKFESPIYPRPRRPWWAFWRRPRAPAPLDGFQVTHRYPLPGQGDTITFSRIKNLEVPDGQSPKRVRRHPDRPQPLRARRRPRQRARVS